jgi:pimeloyl-ACP methyl ester carboxylesterase
MMGSVRSDGCDLYYEEAGDGVPIVRLTRSLASAIPTAKTHQIEGAGHAAVFDATSNFVQLIADTITSERRRALG